jgi:hypothetical protein
MVENNGLIPNHHTWNVRSLYRAGSLKTVSRELARYKLDGRAAPNLRENTHFSMERGMRIMN